MRAKLVLAVPGGPSSTMWFSLVRRGLLTLGGQQLVDLNLGAPHRDLLLGPVQPDQLVQSGLRPGQHARCSSASAAASRRSRLLGGRVPRVGAGGDGVGVGDDEPEVRVVQRLPRRLQQRPVHHGRPKRSPRPLLIPQLPATPPPRQRDIGGDRVGCRQSIGELQGGRELAEAGRGAADIAVTATVTASSTWVAVAGGETAVTERTSGQRRVW